MILGNRNTRTILFGVLSITLVVVLSFLFKYYNRDESVTYRIQNRVTDKINILENVLERIDVAYNKDSLFLLYDELLELYDKDGLSFAIIKDDKPVFWSTPLVIKEFDSINHWSSMHIRYNRGTYILRHFDRVGYSIVGLAVIKNNFEYKKQRINTAFHDSFYNIENILIVDYQTNNAIFDNEGNFLFSVVVNRDYCYNTIQSFVLFMLYIIGFFSITYGFWHYIVDMYSPRYNRILLFFYFIIVFVAIKSLLSYLEIPPALYHSPLFSKEIYDPIVFGSSFGDFIINSMSIFFFSYLLYDNVYKYECRIKLKIAYQWIFACVFFLCFFSLFIMYIYMINNFISNADIWFKLTDFQNLDYLAFVGIYVIMALFGSYFYVVFSISYCAVRLLKDINLNIASLLYFPFSISMFFIYPFDNFIVYSLFSLIFFFSIHFIHLKTNRIDSISLILFYIILFAGLTAYLFTIDMSRKEKNMRIEMINDLAFGRIASFAESNFNNERNEIANDKLLNTMLTRYYLSSSGDKMEIVDYINRKHFKGSWDKYNLFMTICFSNDRLLLSDSDTVNCGKYFNELISDYGIETSIQDFYLLEFSPNETTYLGIIEVYISGINERCYIYVEIFPKPVSEIKEYDGLIIDRAMFSSGELNRYSFARYFFDDLSYKIGDYEYEYHLNDRYKSDSTYKFVDFNGYSHLLLRIDKDEYIILSTELPNITSILAPFSYVLLCYFIGFILISLSVVIFSNKRVRPFKSYIRNIQVMLVVVIFISLLVISVFSIYSIIDVDNKREVDNITEKIFSIQNNFNALINNNGVKILQDKDAMNSFVDQLSNTFSADINIYNTSGKLISTSIARYNEDNLLSEYMDAEAYRMLHDNNAIMYINKENMDSHLFNSVYMSLIDRDYGVVGYINVPYFRAQKESKNSLFEFIIKTVNLYIVLIAVSLIIIYFVSKAIIQPLKLLNDKLMKFDLFKRNEKIEWKANDEIGLLIKEYNRVVDELTISAEKLASSEREMAWRNMARQIAHEVKNPLTPMKLSIQHLQRAWQKNDPDFEQRLNRFTNTMIEQIDTLSSIASAFSSYAKLGGSNPENVDIVEVLNNVIVLYKDANARFAYSFFANKSYVVNVDRNQMTQVFNNLITNAIQAISVNDEGLIMFDATEQKGYVIISISDNGCGMDEEQKTLVFTPYFTTKTSGTGLGLSIVKTIINSFGGEIYFKSEKNIGTVFYIKLKLVNEE